MESVEDEEMVGITIADLRPRALRKQILSLALRVWLWRALCFWQMV
ncbi:MAG: hypothetical protein OEZ48_13645 [Candidatus Bathyarchaeota archaeon]|nr:hypothetical protein [Candidatus Bathyarchaeota archaeon]